MKLNYLQSYLDLLSYQKYFRDFHKKNGKFPAPSYVLWDSTRRCNLRCLHCGASKESYDNELGTQQVKDLIDELASLKVKTFAATGGEPLLRTDLLEIMAYADAKGLSTGIATNGYFLDLAKAHLLKEAGIRSIQISIDGNQETHNHIRGNPESFSRALSAATFCRQAGIPLVTIASVVTTANLSILPELKQILLDNSLLHWKIIPLMPIGRAEKDGLQIDNRSLKILLSFITKAQKEMDILIGENLPYFGKWDARVRKSVTYCPVGITACCIGVDGRVRGCPEMPDSAVFSEGRILEQSFNSIWQNGFGRYRDELLKKEDKDCHRCRWWRHCRGGCWVMRLNETHCIKSWKI